MDKPSKDDLILALEAASAAHHDYQVNALKGERDENWSGWYAAYVLGRLGDFISPTILAAWLEQITNSDNWTEKTAEHVVNQLQPL